MSDRLRFKRDRRDIYDLGRQRYTCEHDGRTWEIDNSHVWMASPTGEPTVWLIAMRRREMEQKIMEYSG